MIIGQHLDHSALIVNALGADHPAGDWEKV
jgi:hypothetical protein